MSSNKKMSRSVLNKVVPADTSHIANEPANQTMGELTNTSSNEQAFATEPNSSTQPTTDLTEFTLFPKLAPELRLMIFKFALPTGYDGERMIPLNLEHQYEYDDSPHPVLKSSGLDFTVEPGANQVHAQCHDVYDLSLSSTSRESREAYLSVFSRQLSLKVGMIHFSPGTTIYLAKLGCIMVDDNIAAVLASLTRPNSFTTAVDHLAGPRYTLGATLDPMLNGTIIRIRENFDLWIGFLANFKSLTMVHENFGRATVVP
ncbi:uncharacterized protein PAC_11619 [Phialocephala subalpina]|uniref:2EXR domain-containing protein n=1 Tax=Phialocephala subalpina TaxID=576137 RepID=A0A1L7X9N3_9HELO|nr:uncharacterized protein PAC_11619 [Phialocephala subalpina]